MSRNGKLYYIPDSLLDSSYNWDGKKFGEEFKAYGVKQKDLIKWLKFHKNVVISTTYVSRSIKEEIIPSPQLAEVMYEGIHTISAFFDTKKEEVEEPETEVEKILEEVSE